MTEDSAAVLAKRISLGWCAAMRAPHAVQELLERRLYDLGSEFGHRAITGANVDRLGLECIRRIAEMEVPQKDHERAKQILVEAARR